MDWIKNYQGKSGGGFTIAEIIIAISILSFGIVLVYGAFSSIVIVTNNVQSRLGAAYLAQEGLEVIRNLRDNNFITREQDPSIAWSEGLLGSSCGLGCMVDYATNDYTKIIPWDGSFLGRDDQGFYSYDPASSPTIFTRKITITPILGQDEAMNVSVQVSWTYNGRSFTFNVDENLYDWY